MLRSPATAKDFSFDFTERRSSCKADDGCSFEADVLDESRSYPQEEQYLESSKYSFPHFGQNILYLPTGTES